MANLPPLWRVIFDALPGLPTRAEATVLSAIARAYLFGDPSPLRSLFARVLAESAMSEEERVALRGLVERMEEENE